MEDGLDPLIHPLPRLRICALLDPVTQETFGAIRDLLGLSDATLSKHVRTLVDAGYLEPTNAQRSGRRPVSLRLTPGGRTAFHRHVAALAGLTGPVQEEQE